MTVTGPLRALLAAAALLPALAGCQQPETGAVTVTVIGGEPELVDPASGPLDPAIEEAITKHDIVGAAVLSGNRNFEARIHQAIRANFLASPPLVVAFALAGTVNIDISKDAIGTGWISSLPA